MRSLYLSLILLVFFASDCTRKKTDSPIQIDTLVVNFYADSLVLSEEAKLSGMDSASFASAVDSLHSIHGISKEKADSLIQSYRKDLPTWKSFFEMLVKRLEYLRTKI